MKILEELISSLDFNTTIRDIRQGVFHTGVLTRGCGLAATLPRDSLKQGPPLVREAGLLMDKSPSDLARMAYSDKIPEAAIGIATINSLLEIKEEDCLDLNARDLIEEKGRKKRIAIVGHFPFISRLHESADELWVIEKNPREGDFSDDNAADLIPMADVVGITGTALTNHTLESLLALCDPRAYVVILGDSAPLSPILFDHGADAVSGTIVKDSDMALRYISQGANFRQIKGIRKLTMIKR
jgi:hypothetical protein